MLRITVRNKQFFPLSVVFSVFDIGSGALVMRSQRHDFSTELREHTIPLFETVEPQKIYKIQLLSQLSCNDLQGAITDLQTVIRHNNVLEIELQYVGISP